MTLTVDVRELVGHPGLSRPVRVVEPIPGLATTLASVPDDRPLTVDLVLEGIAEGLVATGHLTGTMALSCARCLREFDLPLEIEIHEVFAVVPTPREDEYAITEGWMDLEPMIRDNVIPSFPFAPQCRPDCPGLCPRCGGDRAAGACTCGAALDPRWAVLERIDTTNGT